MEEEEGDKMKGRPKRLQVVRVLILYSKVNLRTLESHGKIFDQSRF